MVTCHLKYLIDPYQVPAFEAYGKLWIDLVNRMGGTHHGYFLPSEGANNVAYALFSFPAWRRTSNTAKRPKPTRVHRRLCPGDRAAFHPQL